MKPAARAVILAAAVGLLAACLHPAPNPGAVVLTCTMTAVQDPAVVSKVLAALAQPDFRAKLAALIGIVPDVTAEVIACILRSYLGKLSADPTKADQYTRARTYLTEHGYEVP
jgi:hypothetical protein